MAVPENEVFWPEWPCSVTPASLFWIQLDVSYKSGQRNSLSGDGRVVRDLLDDQLRLAAHVDIGPRAIEQLAENGVQRLLLRAHLLVTGLTSVQALHSETHGVLALQGGNEPLEHTLGAVLGVLALRDGSKELRVLAPVGRELGERGGGQDDCVHRRIRSYELQSASSVSRTVKRAAQGDIGEDGVSRALINKALISYSQGGAVIDDRSPVM